jgi:hypothetical protein
VGRRSDSAVDIPDWVRWTGLSRWRFWEDTPVFWAIIPFITESKICVFHDSGDYEVCRLLEYKNPVRTSQETHYISATEPSRWMLCKIRGFHCGGDYEGCCLLGFLSPWCWKRYVPPKCRFSQEPHGVTSQKTVFFMTEIESRDSAFGIATGYGLDCRGDGVRVPVPTTAISPRRPDWFWRPLSLQSRGHQGYFPPGVKHPRHEADQWLPKSRILGFIPTLPTSCHGIVLNKPNRGKRYLCLTTEVLSSL